MYVSRQLIQGLLVFGIHQETCTHEYLTIKIVLKLVLKYRIHVGPTRNVSYDVTLKLMVANNASFKFFNVS